MNNIINLNLFKKFINDLDTNSTKNLILKDTECKWILNPAYLKKMIASIINNISIETVSLESTLINSGIILRCLCNKPLLQKLSIHAQIGFDMMRAIVEILDSSSPLVTLNINCNVFVNLDSITRAIINHSTLRKLQIRHANIKIGTLLRDNNVLQSLSFTCDSIDYLEIKTIADALTTNTILKRLNLSVNLENINSLKILLDGLNNNTSIISLALSLNANKNNPKYVAKIAKYLARNTTLKNLFLWKNAIDNYSAEIIVESLMCNNTLTTLDLSYNNIGGFINSQARKFSEMLTINKSLKNLHLNHNNITPDFAIDIAKSLICNSTLECLTLDHNIINNHCICDMITLLSNNNSIRTLSVVGNSITAHVHQQLDQLLKDNYTILYLDLGFRSKIIDDILKRNNKNFKESRFKKIKCA
jgi:NLR family CARD domain-containing protein 3